MGFLDHSTNNVLIDAVLTDEGRRLLAANDGSFRISMFSLGDDEVDYSMISKFGRAVGKEKISKNTPVFEAQTRKDLAIKHRLLTLPDQTVTILPTLRLTSAGYTEASNTLAFDANNQNRNLTVEQQIEGESRIPDGLSDSTFSIQLPDRFLRLANANQGFVSLTPNSRIATYKVTAENIDANTGVARLNLNLQVRNGLDDTIYSIFGTPPNKSVIESVISIVGDQSGIRLDFNVQISK